MFFYADNGNNKVFGISIAGLYLVAGSTPTTWSSKRHTVAQTSTFGAESTSLKKSFEYSVMLQYHLRSMGIKVSKPTPVFEYNTSVVLKATNPGSTLNKKTVTLRCHFVREHVANNVVEVRKIHTSNIFADPFTKPLATNYLNGFYHEFMVNV